jgi:DnaJ domain
MGNLYAILGVNRSATPNQIKSAYRRLARKYHPDVNADPAASEKFTKITEAYQILSNPESRERYDRSGRVSSSKARSEQDSSYARAARRAYYQAQTDRVVNEWLQHDREETKARSRAVYTTVTLFFSTFIVAMTNFSIFNSTGIFWRATLVILFAAGVWHLIKSLQEHFRYYTYKPGKISIINSIRSTKPFRRGMAITIFLGCYLLSIFMGMLFGRLTEVSMSDLIGESTFTDAIAGVLFYPPIAVLIVHALNIIWNHFEDL